MQVHSQKKLLAIILACKYFRPYLYGRRFKLQSDNKPLIWLNNLKEENSKFVRWKLALNEYMFDIEYIEKKIKWQIF